jgi:hypothetical protein
MCVLVRRHAKKAIEVEHRLQVMVRQVHLDPRVLDRAVCIGMKIGQEEQAELLAFLNKNSDVFMRSTSDLVGVSRDIIEHWLQVNRSIKPKK